MNRDMRLFAWTLLVCVLGLGCLFVAGFVAKVMWFFVKMGWDL